jgi:hypothetical protein
MTSQIGRSPSHNWSYGVQNSTHVDTCTPAVDQQVQRDSQEYPQEDASTGENDDPAEMVDEMDQAGDEHDTQDNGNDPANGCNQMSEVIPQDPSKMQTCLPCRAATSDWRYVMA